MAFYRFTKLNTIFQLDIIASEEEVLNSVPLYTSLNNYQWPLSMFFQYLDINVYFNSLQT